jgi:predicted dehydrogenase
MQMNRRGFVQASSAAGLTVLGGRQALFGQAAPSNAVRVAVMGCHEKGRGYALMKTVAALPGVEVVTVCDVDARARDAAAAEILKRTQKEPKKEVDLRKVLEDKGVDGVICAAPDHWHAPAALMTMKAGKAIYVEKPVSHNPREGELLVEAAAKTGMVFQMGSQRRSSAVYQSAIKEIQGGVIGEPRFGRCWYATQRGPIGKGQKGAPPEWLKWDLWQGPAPRRDYQDNVVHYTWHWFHHWGTGECGNNATHYVDVARWALGVTFPTRVTSGGGRLFHEGDDWQWFDTQASTFEFPGGKFMTWEGLSSVKARPYEGASTGCMIYGLKGAVLFTPDNVCTLFDPAGKKVKEWNAKDAAADATNRTNPTGGLDAAHLATWIACLRNKDAHTPSPADVAHTSTLLTHLANIAQRTGETVKVDPATGRLAKGSPGAELWAREYEPGWEMSV